MRAEPLAQQSTPSHRPRVAVPAGALVALQPAAGNAAVQRLLAQRYLDDRRFKHDAPPNFFQFRRELDKTHKPVDSLTYLDYRVGNAAQAFIVRIGGDRKIGRQELTPYMSGNPVSVVDGKPKYPPLGKKRSKDRPDNRSACAELRVVSEVRRTLAAMLPDQRPVVYLYTEHLPCKHCIADIVQLVNGHTWVDFVVRWRESFVQDEAGAEEWLAKRRNAAGWCTMTFPHTTEPPPPSATHPSPDRAGTRPRVDKPEKKHEAAAGRKARKADREPLPDLVEVGGPEEAVALVGQARDRVASRGQAGERAPAHPAGHRDQARRRERLAAELVVRQGERQWVSVPRLVGFLVAVAAAAVVVEVLLRALGYR